MKMKTALGLIGVSACAATWVVGQEAWSTLQAYQALKTAPVVETVPLERSISDYFGDNLFLHRTTMSIIKEMSAEEKAGRLLMPAWESTQTLDEFVAMIERYHVQGAMVLRTDATPAQTQEIARALSSSHSGGVVGGLFATDAEPSLMAIRFPSEGYRTPTNTLDTTEKSRESAQDIAAIIARYGYNIDFAPVYDSARNQSVIGNRAFAREAQEILPRANAFARELEEQNIIPVAKHFPGHGYAVGDTHVSLQSIPGSLPEQRVFEEAIDGNIPMVMVGHLAIEGGEYDTQGMPATVSAAASHALLREEMSFQGVVITDAMNMGALNNIDNVDMRALEAGADIVLMPRELGATHRAIVERIKTDASFEASVNEKLYRIVRLTLARQWSL